MRVLLFVSAVLAAWSCSPPCVPVTASAPLKGACRTGTISPDVAFTLRGELGAQSGTCRVSVDAGQIDVVVDNASACDTGAGFADRAAPALVTCSIPALPAGTWQLNSSPQVTFTIPEAADGGIAPCP